MRTIRQYIFVIISAVFLSVFGALALHSAVAQLTPSGPKVCRSNSDCAANQYCAGATANQSGRCNIPPPIWNSNGILGWSPQNASFYIGGNGRIGNILLGYGNQINNVNSIDLLKPKEVAVNYSSGEPVGKGFTVYNGSDQPWFRVDSVGDVTVSNNLKVYGCFGPMYKQQSLNVSNGNAGGYKGANAKCPLNMHVCSTEEILNTVRCGGSLPSSGSSWINNGPPGYTAPANDCMGWTSNNANYRGAYWDFGQGNGGVGILTVCSNSLPFACCQ